MLLVVKPAHEQRIVAVGNEIIFETLHDGFGSIFDIDDGVSVVDCDYFAVMVSRYGIFGEAVSMAIL